VLIGYQTYNPLEGLEFNLANWIEAIAFVYLTFGILWVLSIIYYLESPEKRSNITIKFFPLAWVLIVGTSVFLARLKEIRVIYLLAPWIIYLSVRWLIKHKAHIINIVQQKSYWLYAYTSTLILLIAFNAFKIYKDPILNDWRANAFNKHFWLDTLFVQVLICVLFIPVLAKVYLPKRLSGELVQCA
jgi:hypothetical protein